MNEDKLLKVLLSPHISEKSTQINEDNQYTFKVNTTATKTEIKAAVEKFFHVKVMSVQTVNQKPRKVRFSGRQGVRNAWKKAYVRLATGHQIDFTGAQA